MITSNKRVRWASLAAVGLTSLALTLGACSSGMETSDTGAAPSGGSDGPLTIAYLQKQGDQQYFVDEAQGAKATPPTRAGDVAVKVVDLGTDANKAITEVEAAIAQGVDGIIIVVPDHADRPAGHPARKGRGHPDHGLRRLDRGRRGRARRLHRLRRHVDGRAGRRRGRAPLPGGVAGRPPTPASSPRTSRTSSVCVERVDGAAAAFSEAVGDAPEIDRHRHRQLRDGRTGQGRRGHHREPGREALGGLGLQRRERDRRRHRAAELRRRRRPTSSASASART